MPEIQAHKVKEIPTVEVVYQGEREHIIEKIKALYNEPITSPQREVEKERQLAALFARKRYTEIEHILTKSAQAL